MAIVMITLVLHLYDVVLRLTGAVAINEFLMKNYFLLFSCSNSQIHRSSASEASIPP